jgi:hypothetical protein
MTLDDLVVAVRQLRWQIVPLVSGLALAVDSDDGRG